MEIFWTGLASFLRKDFKLVATTSVWMFFIYGMAVFMEPLIDILQFLPVYIRGGVYVICIFAVEYSTGGMLRLANICPWDYGDSKYSVRGLIRLDYAPAWFIAGLIFEQVATLIR